MTPREEVERVADELQHSRLDTKREGSATYWSGYVAVLPVTVAKAAALLRSLVAERDEAIRHAEALSDSLRCEVERRYAGIKDHPAMRKKYELDMSEVVAFRKWMEGRK